MSQLHHELLWEHQHHFVWLQRQHVPRHTFHWVRVPRVSRRRHVTARLHTRCLHVQHSSHCERGCCAGRPPPRRCRGHHRGRAVLHWPLPVPSRGFLSLLTRWQGHRLVQVHRDSLAQLSAAASGHVLPATFLPSTASATAAAAVAAAATAAVTGAAAAASTTTAASATAAAAATPAPGVEPLWARPTWRRVVRGPAGAVTLGPASVRRARRRG